MLLCDCHTHSDNSFDAESTVDELCVSAIKKGLYALAVTDHCEAPFIKCGENCEFGSFDKRIPKSVKEINIAKDKYKGKLKILCGLELGEPTQDLPAAARALDYGDFDFVLASVHNLPGREDFYYLDYKSLDVDALLREYFDEVEKTAAYKGFDSLAHLTYPLRYIVERDGYYPDLTKFGLAIDRIFKILIRNNKALEINVSGLFKPIGVTLPDERLISRFYELGGRLITIGTDAHSAEMLGEGLSQGIDAARRAGFVQYAVYEKRTPVMIDF